MIKAKEREEEEVGRGLEDCNSGRSPVGGSSTIRGAGGGTSGPFTLTLTPVEALADG